MLRGEASPFYMFCPHSPRRMAELLPAAKIIVLLRNPIDRAFSHYHLEQRHGHEPLSFEEAITAEETRIGGEYERLLADQNYDSHKYRTYAYVKRGIYVDQIVELKRHFQQRNLLVLQSEQFFRETAAVFDRVLDFLELPHWNPPEFANLFPGNYRSSISPETRDRLRSIFAPHNARLYAELGETYDWD